METQTDWLHLGGAIITGSGVVAGALKLLAMDLRKSINGLQAATREHGQRLDAAAKALDRNTAALESRGVEPEAGRNGRVRVLPLLLLPFLLLAGCAGVPADYLRADKATYAAIGSEYRRYVGADESLDGEQKALRLDTLDSWALRVKAAEAAQGRVSDGK